MAGSFNASSAGFFIRSPRQASTIFGLDGASAPRSKGLFYVCFKQSGQVSTPATSGWQNNMGFLVKNIDRPSIQPEIAEVNQYNKKRQVTLGYKIAPLKMTLYDTADSMVMQMWNEYSQWYFGDFGQSASSYSYDVTTANVNDTGSGFGYQPRPSSSSGSKDDPNDLNSQFFFSAIEVYQVFGGQYTRFDLINPKITAFDPDEMDYSSSEVAMINISIAYEAVLYQNNGQPVAINQDTDAYAAFNGNFDGDAYSVGGAPPRQTYGTSQPNTSLYPLQNFNFTSLASAASSLINDAVNTVGGGSLSQFGNYDFGSLTTGVSLGGSTAADVAYLSSGNNALSSLLNLPVGSPAVTNPESNLLGASGNQPLAAISGDVYDSTIGALAGAGNPSGNPYASSYIQSNLVGGVAASAALSQNGPTNQLTTTGASGLTLNSQSYGIINAQMPAYSQLGYNAGVSDAYSPNSLPSSLPSDDSSFDDLDLSDLA